MNLKKIIKESIDDFDWMRGDLNFTINDIIGKKMLFRNSNLSEILENQYLMDIQRNQLTLGKIKWDDGWYVDRVKDNGTVYLNLDGAGLVDYKIDVVEKYVNLGVWVLLDDNGNILNNFSNNIKESDYYLDKIVKRLSILNEDGKTKPDMEWDFTKKELDKSKQWVKTKEDVKEYLKLLFQKIKDLPKATKIKILKYVLISFVGLIGLKDLNTVTKEVSPEKIDLVLKQEAKKEIKIRKSSNELLDHLKWEEGSIREKGKPVLTAYDLGDGAYTIGYGHAVFKDPSRGDNGGKYEFLPKYENIIPGKTKITPKQAEILLKDDIKIAEDGLNHILNDWESQGIKPEINQNMYDAMISMIFNMGIQNFRMSEFIQMIKRGDMKSASNEIKNISSHMFNKYPGLEIRRKKESQLFSS